MPLQGPFDEPIEFMESQKTSESEQPLKKNNEARISGTRRLQGSNIYKELQTLHSQPAAPKDDQHLMAGLLIRSVSSFKLLPGALQRNQAIIIIDVGKLICEQDNFPSLRTITRYVAEYALAEIVLLKDLPPHLDSIVREKMYELIENDDVVYFDTLGPKNKSTNFEKLILTVGQVMIEELIDWENVALPKTIIEAHLLEKISDGRIVSFQQFVEAIDFEVAWAHDIYSIIEGIGKDVRTGPFNDDRPTPVD